MADAVFCRTLLALALVLPLAAVAQEEARDPRGPSADGNYWFEVEVTVFSSVYGGNARSEVPVPSDTLAYLAPLRQLQVQADSFRFPFTTDGSDPFAPLLAPAVAEGPVFSPADPAAFKILDHERDPYVALDRRYWRFSQLNSRLQSNGEHAVLWHQVWRQPLRPRGLAQAVLVEGGNHFGHHAQLEGSVRVTGQNDQAAVDANLWFSSFGQDRAAIAGEWKLPELPALAAAKPPVAGAEPLPQAEQWYPYNVWQLNQSRELGPNALYYLDHPVLGMLIEIRPYLVPEQKVPATAEVPRTTPRTGFE